jgi:membrane protease YdiL (CAAX protease family)
MGETPETDPLLEAPPAEPPQPEKTKLPPPPPERSQRELWLETAVVLVVAVVPTVFNAFTALIWPGGRQPRTSIDDSLYFLVYALGPSVLVLYLINRSGEAPVRFGLVRPLWFRDIAGALGLFAVHWVLWQMLAIRFESLFDAMDKLVPVEAKDSVPTPHGLIQHVLVGVSCAAIGFCEEIVTRGYLLTRFEQLFNSTWKSVASTAFLFALWHVYQGMTGFVYAGLLGLLFGVVFCWIRRIWPLAICHALLDWMAITRAYGS